MTLSSVPREVTAVRPIRTDCPCGCERYGTPRKHAWRDGLVHIRQCECRYCTSATEKPRAMRREARIARDSGGRRNPGSGAQGGMDLTDHICDIEETANKAVVRGFKAWWSGSGIQGKVRYLLSRNIRPRVLILSWDDEPQMAVLPYSDFCELCLLVDQGRKP